MDKKIRIGILIGFIIICLDVLILGNDSVDEAQSRRDIFADSSVIDLGNHIIAYRTSSDILDISYKGSYLAIDDLDSGETLYLPDIYEEVYKMELEDDGSIFISYKDMIHNRIQAASIPVSFPTRDNSLYEITEIQRKILTEAQGNISKAADELPKLIWSEKVNCESGTYEIAFERTSFAYKNPAEKGELFADYCLTFKDGDDNILAEQAMINYPIKYEEVYWVRDFSGDDLPDIAFYTGIFQSDGTDLEFIMSNAETKAYEAVRLPIRLTKTQMPVWNEKQSAVILYEMLHQNVTMKMYSFHDMRWELVDELLPMYEEERGSIWARNNKEDVKLYPEIYSEGEWETIAVTIGEDTITKYVRRETVKTNEGSFFSDGNIVYLGGYMKAYLMDASMDVHLLRGYEGEWIVINDAEEGKSIYLRNEFSKILDIRIEDFSAVYIKYENGEEAGVQELTVPLCFSWKKEDVLELYPNVERVVVEPPTAALALPETVWEESITYQGTSYLAVFERISPAYFGSECYGKHADYQLVVRDENGNTIASRIITGYPIAMEEVFWLKDISGDGFPDVILCSFCEQNKRVGYDTDLHFFVWNKEKLMYESKPLADYMYDPFWSEELSSIIFFCLDDYAYMRYTFRDGEWQLSGKLAEDLREAHDENSPWCKRNVQNEKLFPRSEGWDTEDKELEGGQTTWKFVREVG